MSLPCVYAGINASELGHANAKIIEKTQEFKYALRTAIEEDVGDKIQCLKWPALDSKIVDQLTLVKAVLKVTEFLSKKTVDLEVDNLLTNYCRMTPTGWISEYIFTISKDDQQWNSMKAIEEYAKTNKVDKDTRHAFANMKIKLIVAQETRFIS